MKLKMTFWLPRVLWACALGPNTFSTPAPGAEALGNGSDTPPPKPLEAIGWSQVGAKAGAAYRGDGLGIFAVDSGAHLSCAFQRLEGNATAEGLWLASNLANSSPDGFKVKAVALGRQATGPQALGNRGRVSMDGESVRLTRPGLVEEYSVSMDGVRQDFVVTERPAGASELEVWLEVKGARVRSATTYGAELQLEHSGRKLAYSRLQAKDARGKTLPAGFRVGSDGKSQLSIWVNDQGAVYPVRIDPTFSDANWISLGGNSRPE